MSCGTSSKTSPLWASRRPQKAPQEAATALRRAQGWVCPGPVPGVVLDSEGLYTKDPPEGRANLDFHPGNGQTQTNPRAPADLGREVWNLAAFASVTEGECPYFSTLVTSPRAWGPSARREK